jgi:hypothetical protein
MEAEEPQQGAPQVSLGHPMSRDFRDSPGVGKKHSHFEQTIHVPTKVAAEYFDMCGHYVERDGLYYLVEEVRSQSIEIGQMYVDWNEPPRTYYDPNYMLFNSPDLKLFEPTKKPKKK